MATASDGHPPGAPAPWRADARLVAWWLAVGAGAGALVGLVVGGIGGRLLMLALRLESPDAVGLTSDDGFEIGRVSLESIDLLVFGASAGALFGALYMLGRRALPRPGRAVAATLAAATVGGGAFLTPDGTDLAVLDPLWLAVAGFIALPAAAALAIALLVERWSKLAPWSLSRRRALAFTPILLAAPIAPVLAVGAAGVLAARRVGGLSRLAPMVRIVVPIVVLAIVVTQGLSLIDEVDRIP